ncbi:MULTISPECIES: DNA-3-methyladenine glycosylase family protein [Bacillus]|uniref:DNA-3-methyladenine glycosylase family protein n=1 Tax=Bacillus TaxID=1386 RepID=UPI00030F579A|nr:MULTISPECIES: DNA-3-methyladenine glycosylase [Bacillus]
MWKEIKNVSAPYHFEAVLDRLSLDPLQTINMDERTIKVPLYIDGNPEIITITAIGTINQPAFEISGPAQQTKDKVMQRISRIFHWHIPLANIEQHFKDTTLKSLFEIHRGTAIVLDFDYFGSLTKSIIHQQLNLKFAYVLTTRFVQTYGEKIDGVWFYPKPEKVAKLTVEELKELQFSGRKAEYVIGLANEIVQGNLDLEGLLNVNDEEVIEILTRVRGIGKWTAESFLLFALGRTNIFPKADIGIQNAIKNILHLPEKPTIDQMLSYSKQWEPYLSYASLYLWRSTEKRSENK